MSESHDIQQSTSETEGRPRRLVPQFSLNNNRQDIKQPTQNQSQQHHDQPKKTVTRFTREQLIALRKHSTILPSMKAMAEVASIEQQEPVCFTKLEPEDVVRIWNAASKDTAARTRPRPRPREEGFEEGETQGGDLWDDGGGLGGSLEAGKEFDLTDISKASLQFRTDMDRMKLGSDVELAPKEVDTMESLIEEQSISVAAHHITKKEEHSSISINAVRSHGDSQAEKKIEEKILSAIHISQPVVELPKVEPSPVVIEHKPLPISNVESSFLKSAAVENVFLSPLQTNSSSLLNQPFPVNSFYQSEPLIYPPQPPQPQIIIEPEWFYTDPQQQVQGPFSQENMRLWNEAGYFGKELPIKLRQWTKFYLFKDVFPDSRLAFYTVPHEPAPRPAFNALNNPSFFSQLGNTSNLLGNENLRRHNPLDFSLSSSAIDKPSLVLGSAGDPVMRSLLHQDSKPIGRAHIEEAAPSLFDSVHTLSGPSTTSGRFNLPNEAHKIDHHQQQQQLAERQHKLEFIEHGKSTPQQQVQTQQHHPVPSQHQFHHQQHLQQQQQQHSQAQRNSIEKSDYAKQILGINHSKKQDAPVISNEPPAKTNVGPQPLNNTVKVPDTEIEKQTAVHSAQESHSKSSTDKQNKGWKTESVTPKPVSLLEIQQEAVEEQKKNVQTTPTNAASVTTSAPSSSSSQPTQMSVQLKSLLGLKSSGIVPPNTTAPGKPKPAWGASVAPTEAQPIPTLKDIMKEEITQQQKKEDPSTGVHRSGGSSSWASKIGVGAAPGSPVVSQSLPPSIPQIKQTVNQQSSNTSNVEKTPTSNHGRIVPSKNDKSDFGGRKMTKELADWCASQLKGIKGSDDLTLMEFCMSLNSAVEIRETLSSYLGSSPQVTNFATEFIKYKEDGKPPVARPPISAPESQTAINNSANKKKKPTGGK